eukprot:jgi/Picre1/28299/NNA_003705.t1
MATSPDVLCRYSPPPFRRFTEAVINLKFDDDPKYSSYMALFEPLCGPPGPSRPLMIDLENRVGQKRARDGQAPTDDELDLPASKKRVRLGLPATQWINSV